MLPVPGGDKEWYLYAARAGLLIGVATTAGISSLNTIARAETGIGENNAGYRPCEAHGAIPSLSLRPEEVFGQHPRGH